MNIKKKISADKERISDQSWTLIIIAYNEEHTIEKVCRQAVDFLSPLSDSKKEIIIIDDGSLDSTSKKIKCLVNKFAFVRSYYHERNLGIGAALTRGYLMSQMENICAVPGDGQFDLDELRAFRNVPDSTVVSFYRTGYGGYSSFRKLLTKTNRWINKVLFGFSLRDVNYIKIYKKDSLNEFISVSNEDSSRILRSVLKETRFVSKSSYIESEIMYYLTKKNLKIIQTPAEYLSRKHGISSAVQLKILKMVFKDIFKLLKIRMGLKYKKRSN